MKPLEKMLFKIAVFTLGLTVFSGGILVDESNAMGTKSKQEIRDAQAPGKAAHRASNLLLKRQHPLSSELTQIALGSNHACALTSYGEVLCWGDNSYGQSEAPELFDVAAISTGLNHSCAIADGKITCWGDNGQGQLNSPQVSRATAISSYGDYSCAIADEGVMCWGDNNLGQTQAPKLTQPTAIATSQTVACASSKEGLVCWGEQYHPYQVIRSDLTSASAISVFSNRHSHFFACATTESGVSCWEFFKYYRGFSVFDLTTQTNSPDLTRKLTNPAAITHHEGAPWTAVGEYRKGNYSFCALADEGVDCWNKDGTSFTDLPSISRPRAIASSSGSATTCALADEGLVCWGSNGKYFESSFPKYLLNDLNPGNFHPRNLDHALLELSKVSYSEKRAFLTTLAGYADHAAPEQRLFLLNAIEPLMTRTRSEYMESKVLPLYRKALQEHNSRNGVNELKDFWPDPANVTVALQTLHAAIQSVQTSAHSPEDHAKLHAVITATGKALAVATLPNVAPTRLRAATSDVLTAMGEARDTLAQIELSNRTAPMAIIARSMEEYLSR